MKTAKQTTAPATAGEVLIMLPAFGRRFAITGSPAAIATVSEMIEHGDLGGMTYDDDEIASLESVVATSVGAGQRVSGHYCGIEALRMLASSTGYARHRAALALAA